MKAVYTKYPYKYWSRGPVGVMHLFGDDSLAELYADNNGWFLIDTPNGPEFQNTWTNLAWSYLTCGGQVWFHDRYGETEITWYRCSPEFDEFAEDMLEYFGEQAIEYWDWDNVNHGVINEEVA